MRTVVPGGADAFDPQEVVGARARRQHEEARACCTGDLSVDEQVLHLASAHGGSQAVAGSDAAEDRSGGEAIDVERVAAPGKLRVPDPCRVLCDTVGFLGRPVARKRALLMYSSRSGRVRVELTGFSTRARAFGGNENFSRRCCRKVSAERSRIEFTTLTLLLESNSRHV